MWGTVTAYSNVHVVNIMYTVLPCTECRSEHVGWKSNKTESEIPQDEEGEQRRPMNRWKWTAVAITLNA